MQDDRGLAISLVFEPSPSDCSGRFDIDDDAVIDVGQVIGLVAELGRTAALRCSARCRVDGGKCFWSDRRCAAKRCIVEHFQMLTYSALRCIPMEAPLIHAADWRRHE